MSNLLRLLSNPCISTVEIKTNMLVEKNPKITNNEIASKLKITEETAKECLRKLSYNNYIKPKYTRGERIFEILTSTAPDEHKPHIAYLMIPKIILNNDELSLTDKMVISGINSIVMIAPYTTEQIAELLHVTLSSTKKSLKKLKAMNLIEMKKWQGNRYYFSCVI